MARARNIKPGFFSNEELVELDMATRLLFIGLWTIADRDGRMEDRPKRIKMQVFPADDVDIDASLVKLADRGFIQRYEVDGMYCIQIVNWKKHQSPHIKETASTIPAPDGTVESNQESGASTGQAPDKHPASRPDSLIPDSLIPDSLIPDSGLSDSEGGAFAPEVPAPDPPPDPAKPASVILTPSRTPKQLAADIAFHRRKGLYDAWCRGIGLDPDGDESAVGRDVAFRNLKPIVTEASPSIQDFEACTAYLVSQDWRTDPPSIPQVIQGFAAWVSKDRPEKAESKVSQISSRQGQSRYETPAERNAKSFDAYRAELRDQLPDPCDDPNVIDVKVSGS